MLENPYVVKGSVESCGKTHLCQLLICHSLYLRILVDPKYCIVQLTGKVGVNRYSKSASENIWHFITNVALRNIGYVYATGAMALQLCCRSSVL